MKALSPAWNDWDVLSAYSGTLSERIYAYLAENSFSGAVDDMLFAYLRGRSYTGSLNEMAVAFEADGFPAEV